MKPTYLFQHLSPPTHLEEQPQPSAQPLTPNATPEKSWKLAILASIDAQAGLAQNQHYHWDATLLTTTLQHLLLNRNLLTTPSFLSFLSKYMSPPSYVLFPPEAILWSLEEIAHFLSQLPLPQTIAIGDDFLYTTLLQHRLCQQIFIALLDRELSSTQFFPMQETSHLLCQCKGSNKTFFFPQLLDPNFSKRCKHHSYQYVYKNFVIHLLFYSISILNSYSYESS